MRRLRPFTFLPAPYPRALFLRGFHALAVYYGGAGSEYAVYLDGGDLVYLKRPCAAEHARGRFLLSVFPADVADIPQDRRALGHDSLNFDFADYGVRFGDRCMIRRPLPDYAVESVEIGRWIPGEGAAWQTRAAIGE